MGLLLIVFTWFRLPIYNWNVFEYDLCNDLVNDRNVTKVSDFLDRKSVV